MANESASVILGQFLLLSLLIERVVAVCSRIFGRGGGAADDLLPPPEPPNDPWQSWTKVQVLTAFATGLFLSYQYQLDLFSALLLPAGKTPTIQADFIGYGFTAAVLAGGSSGLQKAISALSASAKSLKAEARARLAEAKLRPKSGP
jgi:hypothetical protein